MDRSSLPNWWAVSKLYYMGQYWVESHRNIGRFFIFIFYIFVFYKNIFSIWKFTEIYPGRPAARRPRPGRPAAGRQGLIRKKKDDKKLQISPWGPSAGSWAAGPPGHPAAGRPALPPLYKGWLVPPPLICITTIPETKKKERGRERGKALPDFRAGDSR